MELPSSREIELETLLRSRDAQIADLTDEVTHLRQHLSTNPPSAPTDPISLPPALVSLLLPHINERTASATSSSNTVTAALTQRVKVLQSENDELYELLKSGETGRLKDDVRALQRVVQKLEGALRESHQVIASLSGELEKSQAVILANTNRPNNFHNPPSYSTPSAPRTAQQTPIHATASLNGKRPVPTAPRAHKKPRLSDTQTHISPANQSVPLPPQKMDRSHSGSTRRHDSRERSPRTSNDRKPPTAVKMEVEEEERPRQRSPDRNRGEGQRDRGRDGDKDRDRNRVRDRDRNRDRDRERDRDKAARRNGGGGGGGGGRRGQWNNSHANGSNGTNSFSGGDRTLAERMGL